MSDFDRCKKCGEYGWLSSHKCAPIWECRMSDDDDHSWRNVHARDCEDAARRFVERYDYESGECSICSQEETVTVLVRSGDVASRWDVTGSLVPHYTADPADADGTNP